MTTDDNKLLYTLVEWTAAPAAKLIILMIANTFDLIRRHIPRVQSRFGPLRHIDDQFRKIKSIAKTW